LRWACGDDIIGARGDVDMQYIKGSKVWVLVKRTVDELNYMEPLFDFVFEQFCEIFGIEYMNGEPCKVFNDPDSECPQLLYRYTPIRLRTKAKSLTHWAQYIFQLSHELTHYAIRQFKEIRTKDGGVWWFEETICEAMALYIVKTVGERWRECKLFCLDPNYGQELIDYYKGKYAKTADSVLDECHTLSELQNIEETCQEDAGRQGRSIHRNYLFDTFVDNPTCIAQLVRYPLFMRGLVIDFNEWESDTDDPVSIHAIGETFRFQLTLAA